MSVYRTASESPTPATEPQCAVGLVRVNGSNCTCRPPGRLWCWWYKVQLGDRWSCGHGGGWVRWRDSGDLPRWTAYDILTRHGWNLNDQHPMCEPLALLGWMRTPLKDNKGMSTWNPPKVTS